MANRAVDQGRDFRVKDALTTFRDFVKKEEKRRQDSEEVFDQAHFEAAVELAERYLAPEEEEVRR